MSSHQHPTTANVAEIYKSVIADVINQMKESFLDENIDIDVLNQFKKEWEEKVQQSGAVEFEPRVVVQPHPVRPTIPTGIARNVGHTQIGGNARQQQQQQQQQQQLQHHMQQPQSQSVTQLVQHHPQSLQQHMIDQQQQVQNQIQQQLQQQQQAQQVQIQQAQAVRPGLPMPMAYLPVQQPHQSIQQQVQVHQLQQQLGQQIQPIQVTSAPTGMSFQLAAAQGIRMVQGMQPTSQQQQFVIQTVSGPQLSHQQFIMLPSGQQIPVNLNTRIVTQNPTMHQVDGNGDEFGEEEEKAKEPQSSKTQLEPSSSGTNSNRRQRHSKKKVNKPSRREALKVASAIMPELQLDGGGDTITDSSSEEDEVEEEEDQLRRYADSVGNGNADDGEDGDENPLNSDDDQSTDDEDLNTLFDADNVVMCQFEKVHRARNKWKFQLKDGIMHIENKDYCFQKCTGEAEW